MKKFNIIYLFICLFVCCAGYICFEFSKPQNQIKPVILNFTQVPLTERELEAIKNINPYGFLLFKSDFEVFPVKTKLEIEHLLKRKVIFFVDQEGGPVNRIGWLYPDEKFPSANSFEKLAKTDIEKAKYEVYNYGLRIGEHLKDMHIDVNFAPNAEICEKNSGVHMRNRCYAFYDYNIVNELAKSYAAGLKAAGIQPCYKHAIGLGALNKDPHLFESVIDKSEEELQKDMMPFKNASQYDYLMVESAIYTAIDKDNISIFSPKFYKYIRKNLNFNGLIITDALNMKSSNSHLTISQKMTKALDSGADIVMPFAITTSTYFQNEINKIPKWYIIKFNIKVKLLKWQKSHKIKTSNKENDQN